MDSCGIPCGDDLEKKMRSSRLTPSTKEKMNLVFNQLFQKKETKKNNNRVIHNETKQGKSFTIKDFNMLLQKDSKCYMVYLLRKSNMI